MDAWNSNEQLRGAAGGGEYSVGASRNGHDGGTVGTCRTPSSGVDDAAADALAFCWTLGLTSAGGFTRAGSVTMVAEEARRVMRSVVAPRTAMTSHGRERESRVGVLGPAVRSSFGGKAPPWAGRHFPTSRDLTFCVNGVSPPRYSRSVAPLGSGGL